MNGILFLAKIFSSPSCPLWCPLNFMQCEVDDYEPPCYASPVCSLPGFIAWYLGTVICLYDYISLLYHIVFLLPLWWFPLLLQRQAIQDEIQRKKEALQEEKRRRRSQCRSAGDDKASAVNSDHLSHLERSRSCSFVRTCSNSRRRWDLLVEVVVRLQS